MVKRRKENMPEELTIEKLREEVNPVYNTAQSCLQIVAAVGDEDSEELRKKLGFSVFGDAGDGKAKNVPPEVHKAIMQIKPVMTALPEARFFASNNFIKETGAKQVLDLPCGYTARGIKLAKSGIRYFGTDLPAVIDAIKPAVNAIIGDGENVSYCEVDATNYASLRKALQGADGQLHITTEGLLMYFTQPELETVFGNIRRLLLEFGGKWVTPDNEMNGAMKGILSVITVGMDPEEAKKIAYIAAGSAAKTTMVNNVFFDEDKEKAKKFVSDMGFELELVPLSKYMPRELMSFKELPEEDRQKAMDAFGSVNFWVMTAKPGSVEDFHCTEDQFKADIRLTDDVLNISMSGRLDTISSPGLLGLYKEAKEKGKISSVCIDMSELEYISSAGLRVLMIMRKELSDGKDFSLINMKDSIREIIETTGFDTIFC